MQPKQEAVSLDSDPSWNRKFDHIFHIVNADVALQALAGKHEEELLRNNGDYIKTSAPYIRALVEESLGRRVASVDVQCGTLPNRKPDTSSPVSVGVQLTFGLVLAKHYYKDTLERGPEANTPAAAKFLHFWGKDASKLRRFPDGSMAEGVAWKAETEEEKRLICAQIVRQALARHAVIPKKSIVYLGNFWDDTLRWQRVVLPASMSSTGEEYFSTVKALYDTLSRHVRKIPDLPLSIATIRSVSAVLRGTEVFPPLPLMPFNTAKQSFIQPYLQTIPLQVVMEGSSKWPNDRNAIARLKTAFQLKVADSLKDEGYAITVPDVTRLEVWSKGYCFVLEVVYLGELALSRKVTLPDGRFKLEDTDEFLYLKEKYDLDAKLASAVEGLKGQDDSYGLACRIAKRWMASQLLDGYISHQAVELLMAQVYVRPLPFEAPVSSDVAFIRFLTLVTSHDWQRSPLIVDLKKDMTHGDISALKKEFVEGRKSFPAMTIITHFDGTSTWTRESPSAVVLKRFCLLAKVALAAADVGRMSPATFDPKTVFRPPANDEWDCLIHLRENGLSRRHEVLDLLDDLPMSTALDSKEGVKKQRKRPKKSATFPTLDLNKVSEKPKGRMLLDFDPVGEYVRRLREDYGHFAYFLADPHGGSVLLVVWKTAQFKTLLGQSEDHLSGRMVEKAEQLGMGKRKAVEMKVCPNIAAMVEDFTVLGRGLVARVEIRPEKWKI